MFDRCGKMGVRLYGDGARNDVVESREGSRSRRTQDGRLLRTVGRTKVLVPQGTFNGLAVSRATCNIRGEFAIESSVACSMTRCDNTCKAIHPDRPDPFVASAKDVEITPVPDQTILRAMLPNDTASFDLDAVPETRNGDFDWIGWD